MTSRRGRLTPTLTRAATALALAAGSLTVMTAVPAQAADPVTIQLLGMNDFHGRIEAGTTNLTTKFATTVEDLRAADGAAGANTAFVSGGDNISASLFASASQQDQPTIDVLNALGLDASTVGNHEFDQGFADLRDRVIGPEGARNADWDFLGANVYLHGTQTPALPEYTILDVGGLKVGVIGAVTQETPSLVSPAGVAELDFGDPVEAVNRVAAVIDSQVDVTVATFHEGAPEGTPDGATLEEEVAEGGAFADIVNETSGDVDAIFTGHTHKAYAWEGQIPGQPAGSLRPIIQTGSYAANVGKITLTVDKDTDAVSAYSVANVATAATVVNTTYPRVQAVKDIVDAAVAQAAIIGNAKVGEVTADVTTAYSGDPKVRDDRGSESTLGNLVANALRDSLEPTPGGADIGIVNPGGLRAELFYAGDTTDNAANVDGAVTYAEANGVLPFVNTLGTVTLTGAELKEVLEQQYQPTQTRKFLHLGLSDNVQTTLDSTLPLGSRVTSVLIDGTPLDPAAQYKVATFSFLAVGGDNFTAFRQGTYVDSGLVDRDAWIDYLTANSAITPSFARRQVEEHGLPSSVEAGDDVSFTLSKLNLTSLGSPANTEVEVSLRPADGGARIAIDTYDVEASDGGSASINFTAPDDLAGAYTVVAVAKPTGTTIGLGQNPSKLTATAARATYGISASVRVNVESAPAASGLVKVYDGLSLVGTGTIDAGQGTVLLAKTALLPGAHTLTVKYVGGGDVAGSQSTVSLAVVKATSKVKATSRPAKVVVAKTRARVAAKVTAPGLVVGGRVVARVGGSVVGQGVLANGKVVLELKKFTKSGLKQVVVKYLGSAVVRGATTNLKIRVVK